MNSPAEVAKNYIGIGKGKATNGFWKLLILGMLAGAFIGLAGVGATTAAVSVQSASVGKFLGACIFPVGLSMVLLAGSELFTGNNLIIIPVLTGDIKFHQMLRNWVIVYIGNLIGSIIVAFLVVYGHVGNLFGGAEGGLAAAMISAANGNGIAAKDDLKVTGGTYKITSSGDSIEVKDSVSICGGTIEIESSKDGIQCKNKDDETKGAVYIAAATIRINAANDAVQAATVCQIDSGTLELSGNEGIESTYVQINGGEIVITATDDGINAGQKTNYSTPTIEINDGSIKITVGQGDTDAIDSNGDIIVNGGTIDITSTVSSFDYDGTAQYNGGTIIINGEQVDSIPQSTMGGGMGGMPGMQ